MDLIDRARAYVAKMPEAVAGQDGHGATFAVARTLLHFFQLPRAQAATVLDEFNQRCAPPWSAKELKHKLDSAEKTRWEGPRATDDAKRSGPKPAALTGKARTLRTGFSKSVKPAASSASQSRTLRTEFLHNYAIHARTQAHEVERGSQKNPSEASEPKTPETGQGNQPKETGKPPMRTRLARVDHCERKPREGWSTWINARGTAFAARERIVDDEIRIEIGRQISKPTKPKP